MTSPGVPRAPRALWLALPLFVAYPLWVALAGVSGASAAFGLGFVLCAFPLVAILLARGEGAAWLAPPVAMLAGFLLGLFGSVGLLGSPDAGLAVLGGLLVGLPLALAAVLLRRDVEFGTPWMLVVAGTLDTLVVQAALSRVAGEGIAPTADTLTVAAGQVVHLQVGGLGTLLTGGTPGVLPLQALSSPGFAVLVLLALVGGFLTFFVPDGPDEPAPGGPASDTLLPFLVAVAAASVFELLAAREPDLTLLVVAGAVVASVVAVVALARPRRRPRGTRAAPAE